MGRSLQQDQLEEALGTGWAGKTVKSAAVDELEKLGMTRAEALAALKAEVEGDPMAAELPDDVVREVSGALGDIGDLLETSTGRHATASYLRDLATAAQGAGDDDRADRLRQAADALDLAGGAQKRRPTRDAFGRSIRD